MSENYFAIERYDESVEGIVLRDENGHIAFEDIMNMSYEEIMGNSQRVQNFVETVMDATNMYFDTFEDAPTVVTLIGPDDVFIWGIMMEPYEDEIRYAFINWKKDGQCFKYEEEIFEKGIDKLN